MTPKHLTQSAPAKSKHTSVLLNAAVYTNNNKPNVETQANKQSRFNCSFAEVSVQTTPKIQTKLKIGAVGDKYEQEADRVAKDVVQRINAPITNVVRGKEGAQRQADTSQHQATEEEELQLKQENGEIQRKQLPVIVQRWEAKGGREVSTDLESTLNSARGGGRSLDAGLQQSMGQAMGRDFSGVRVHTDARADALNRSLGARAFTTEQDLFFKWGEYQPGSRGGQELIAHELTHVLQQRDAIVQRSHEVSKKFMIGIIQRAPWQNEEAKFKTDNEMPDIPNSEYMVHATGYKRYAPINENRAPGQFYHEGPRSFAYVYSKDENSPAYEATETATAMPPGNTWLKLTGSGKTIIASRIPKNGLRVWDGDVADDGTVSKRHPGHTVTELGFPLPHLENSDLQSKAREAQLSVKIAQDLGIVDSDEEMIDQVYKFSDDNFNGDDNAALKYLADNPKIIPTLKTAKRKGLLNAEFKARFA